MAVRGRTQCRYQDSTVECLLDCSKHTIDAEDDALLTRFCWIKQYVFADVRIAGFNDRYETFFGDTEYPSEMPRSMKTESGCTCHHMLITLAADQVRFSSCA